MTKYSVKLALAELDEQISKLRSELDELTSSMGISSPAELATIITTPDKIGSISNKAIKDINIKVRLLQELEEKRATIAAMPENESYRGENPSKVSIVTDVREKRLDRVNEKIERAGSRASSSINISHDSSKLAIRESERAVKQLIRLQNKKCRIEGRQRLVNNFRLKRELRKKVRDAKYQGVTVGNEQVQEKYSTIKTSYNEAARRAFDDRDFLGFIEYKWGSFVNFTKSKLLELVTKIRSMGPVVVEGFNKLPDKFKTWLSTRASTSGRSR